MNPLIEHATTRHTPESLAEQLRSEPGVVLLQSPPPDSALEGAAFQGMPQPARYSFVTARPFAAFRSAGSRCAVSWESPSSSATAGGQSPRRRIRRLHFGNPWQVLGSLMSRYELLDEWDLPLPLGGCFGWWGYDLKNFVEPKLPRRAVNDLDLPDCNLGFYDSLVAFDHALGKVWIISTGLAADGSRHDHRAKAKFEFWAERLEAQPAMATAEEGARSPGAPAAIESPRFSSNFSRAEFVSRVRRAQQYIRAGDIYQVNLSQRLAAPARASGWEFFKALSRVSPAPFSAFLDCGKFQIASSSPELFLQLSGAHVRTRPIKGTRPRSADPTRDAQWSYELQTSPKEMAELVMITDLLRNDLGKVCEFGSIHVPDLARLERYPQVQHLVSTIEGRLRSDTTHLSAFASCFPGGSVTGAPKFRAMEIIDELEPLSRGPYTGALGFLGFNRESQLSVIIRSAVQLPGAVCFSVGAGIVADSDPQAEYEETLAKAGGFMAALEASSVIPPRADGSLAPAARFPEGGGLSAQ